MKLLEILMSIKINMSTLIILMSGDKMIARCDERCYAAKNKECNCICNGNNHRKGLDRALKNTEAKGRRWINDRKYLEDKFVSGEILPKPIQYKLFNI